MRLVTPATPSSCGRLVERDRRRRTGSRQLGSGPSRDGCRSPAEAVDGAAAISNRTGGRAVHTGGNLELVLVACRWKEESMWIVGVLLLIIVGALAVAL